MQIEDYLMDGETIEARVPAYNKHEAYSNGHKGILACTPLRVIYVNDHDVVDISLQSINSVDYTEPSPSQRQINGGVVAALIGAVSVFIAPVLRSMDIIPPGIASKLTLIGALLGFCFIALGVYNLYIAYARQRSKLTFYTPSRSYDFSAETNNLEQIIHGLRFQEIHQKPTK